MPLNVDLEGRVYLADVVYDVGREKIREFARAVKAANPIHFDLTVARKAGYADLVAPPTFVIIIAQRAEALFISDPESGIDFSRVVHGEQRFEYRRPIVAGDALCAELHVDSVRFMDSNALVTTHANITTVSGETVAVTTSSLVIRAASGGTPLNRGGER